MMVLKRVVFDARIAYLPIPLVHYQFVIVDVGCLQSNRLL